MKTLQKPKLPHSSGLVLTTIVLMTVALVAMGVKGIVAGCVVLGFVWAFHMVYFIWFVKTIPA